MSAELDDMIATLRTLGKDAVVQTAALAAKYIEADVKAKASAGKDPEGRAWAPKVRGGGRPLEHAADAITVRPLGTVITIRLSGVNVYHHFGRGKSEVVRRIVPDFGAGVPDDIAKQVTRAGTEVFGRIMGAR